MHLTHHIKNCAHKERQYLSRYKSPNFINNSPLAEGVSDLLLNEIRYFTSTVGRT